MASDSPLVCSLCGAPKGHDHSAGDCLWNLREQLREAHRERDEARQKAREYYDALASGTMGEYLFQKHYWNETTECPWLIQKPPEK